MISLSSVFLKRAAILVLMLAIGLPYNVTAQTEEPAECDLPPVDIPGEDLPDFPRFPGSIRVQFTKDMERFSFTERNKVNGISVKFLSTADMKPLMEFYSKNVIDKGWTIISSQYQKSNKASLTLEKVPNRVMLTLEPDTKPAPNRANLSRSNQQSQPMFIRTKCYQISAFLYKIPPPGSAPTGMGYPPR